jgi:hypothetical protein
VLIVLGELALIDVVLGEEQLLRPRDADRLPSDWNLFARSATR